MYNVSSTDLDKSSLQKDIKKWDFLFNGNNSGINTVIVEELLDSKDRASERAKSEFLKNSYAKREISFSTIRTDLQLNEVINVKGLPYIIKNLTTKCDVTKIVVQVKAIRYE